MITDLMTVHRAVMDALAGVKVRTSVDCPVKFYNKQRKLKEDMKFPEIAVQPFAPVPDERKWTEDIKEVDKEAGTVSIRKPPRRLRFVYQVMLVADRFDDVNEMAIGVLRKFESDEGQMWITINNETFDMDVLNLVDTPNLGDGTFEWAMTFELCLPLFVFAPQVVKAIETFTLEPAPTLE
jgi:hypothetical protein